jgi:adenine deaminase
MGAVKRTLRTLDDVRALMAVARGEAPPEILVTGGQILNVYSGELLPGLVAIARGRIAYVGERPIKPAPSTTVIDARDRIVAPGYIDPHAHPFAMYTPDELARVALVHGTTAIAADTFMLLNSTRGETTHEALTALSALPLRYFWWLRLHNQGHSEDEDATFTDERLTELLAREDVRAVGEVTRWPALYSGDANVLARVARGFEAGRRVEGHFPGVSADRLQVLTAAGASSDHEAITADQAMARLRAGLYVMLRHGSLRADLPALAPIATGARAFSGRLMMTPDGPSPGFVHHHGYMDHLIEVAMREGIDATAAYQMATINPATYYGLDEELGGIAPGRRADLVVLNRLDQPRPEIVIAGGQVAALGNRLVAGIPSLPWERWLRPFAPDAWRPDASLFSLDGLPSPTPAMHLENAAIAVRKDIAHTGDLPEGVLRLALISPSGRWRVRALLSGFADDLGGLATSYASGVGLVVLGRSPQDMAVAAARALDLGGGVVLAENGAVRFELPLPLGGTMSPKPIAAISADLDRLTSIVRARGYRHHDLHYTLLFFGFDSLPYVRLTYRGLWDVVAGREIIPREDLR